MLAPIGISVYTRQAHFKRAIHALQQNTLAAQSNLVVYSDAPGKPEDAEAVAEIRAYAKDLSGFRTVTVIERPVNYGGVRNAHQAVLQLVRVFGRTIFIEDDIETAPGFLAFMNAALDYYKDNPAVTSISGYSPPLNIQQYLTGDYFVMNRFCGWGCGLYARTTEWLKQKITQQEYDAVEDKSVFCEFGEDVLVMVKKELAGELDAADVRCMFKQAIHGGATIYPRQSLVQNRGHDGSGYHCGVTKRFQHSSLWDKTSDFVFTDNLSTDPGINKEQQDFRAFREKYVVHKTVYNVQQAKEVALTYIDNLFSDALQTLMQNINSSTKAVVRRVALISTPRVGSTWLSHLLYPYFGKSIHREWLHTRFVDHFLACQPEASPEQYLHLLDKVFDTNTLGLHIHVNQILAWKQRFQIDLLEWFDFDQVIYMEREDVFDQVYSYAVASESGLWGSEIVSQLNLAPSFKVRISEAALDNAFKAVTAELSFVNATLAPCINQTIVYETLVREPKVTIHKLVEASFEEQFEADAIALTGSTKGVDYICAENKEKMRRYFDEQYAENSTH